MWVRRALTSVQLALHLRSALCDVFIQIQDFSSFFWSEDDINARLVRIMKEAFAGIWEVAQEHKVSLRTATFIVGCKRILHARELRGLYP